MTLKGHTEYASLGVLHASKRICVQAGFSAPRAVFLFCYVFGPCDHSTWGLCGGGDGKGVAGYLIQLCRGRKSGVAGLADKSKIITVYFFVDDLLTCTWW